MIQIMTSSNFLTPDERAVGCVFMIIAAMLWVQVIGSACGVLANMDSHVKDFYQTIDELNEMMTI